MNATLTGAHPARMRPGAAGPVRVCMLIWHFHPAVGGAERQCLKLSQGLAARNISVSVVTKRIPGAAREEVMDGIAIHRVPSLSRFQSGVRAIFARWFPDAGAPGTSAGPGWILAKARNVLAERLPRYAFMACAYWKLRRLRDGFDIVHVHEGHWIASLGSRFAARNGKLSIVKEASSGAYLRLNFSTQLWPDETRRADVFIAISRQIARDLKDVGVDEARIRVIPNGVGLPERTWSPGTGERIMLFVGNLSQQPYKGIDVLLRAWGKAKSKGTAGRLVLLGGGEGAELKALSRELGIDGSVVFQGAVRDVEERMRGAAAYVLPSRIEGMSNSLLEAMALGLPVVATRISGSEDLIEDGGNGMLVPSEDPDALAQAMAYVLEHPEAAAEMGRKARRTIAEGFTIKAVADRYEELYHSMLAPAGAGGKREYAR